VTDRIFLSAPDVRHLERDYVMAAIDSNWIAPAGPDLERFEQALAAASGRAHAVALSSGTAALHLALLEAGVQPGDTVLCSSLTFIGSANPIIYCGAQPIFIDSEPNTWNMSPVLLEAELESRASTGTLPKAAVVVDLYGVCADYGTIVDILMRFGVTLVEDAAEALGASYNGAAGGSFGHSAILSFNGNKIITSSGGGAFVTDDQATADRVRYLSTQARQPAVHYEHTEIGFNYRMSNICAALGRAQLETLPDRIARRAEINAAYAELFSSVEGVSMHQPSGPHAANYWLTCALFDESAANERSAVIETLAEQNIESRPVWKPMHLQPVFSETPSRLDGTSQRLFENGICLPSGSGMTDGALDRVLSALAAALG